MERNHNISLLLWTKWHKKKISWFSFIVDFSSRYSVLEVVLFIGFRKLVSTSDYKKMICASGGDFILHLETLYFPQPNILLSKKILIGRGILSCVNLGLFWFYPYKKCFTLVMNHRVSFPRGKINWEYEKQSGVYMIYFRQDTWEIFL